ncbi:hypothetical protein A2671_02425 [Candidatus Kaiserbacteria bacterium RIFCSPHIGHO2_01_FULL_49_13]|uniref:DUF4446 domain-containing protein n=1 Tax=Candidatus Kaiserbacteria bacterium RIFCSPHIGHO2_01_FULL_49_13 TaxID=1798477 RepID=A0A1F6CE24_9BACT|nr:MAG: hypothetical protein A2671_02425 [Candidatus Kaiserbacteria bacterium RIFCSPHIGHO2_01_FULL_49_13]
MPFLALFVHDVTLPLYLLFSIVVCLIVWIVGIENRLRRLLRGKNAATLEDTLRSLSSGQDDLIAFHQDLESYLKSVEERLRRSIQSVHTLRFNPFQGSGGGGNQSFATAFLNEKGDGLILSSLYARGQVSLFAKPVKGGVSEFELSEEEGRALTAAQQTLGRRKTP